MAAYWRSRISVLFLLSLLQVPAFPRPLLGQEERGTVKVDSLPVYAEMSTDSDIVTNLARGKSLRITLSITTGDGMWCSVSEIDGSAKLGFVRCQDLDRQNVPSTAQLEVEYLHLPPLIQPLPANRDRAPRKVVRWRLLPFCPLSITSRLTRSRQVATSSEQNGCFKTGGASRIVTSL